MDELSKYRIGSGLDAYCKIMSLYKSVDVSKNANFQRTFNYFYRVRRNEQWRKIYYDIFQRLRYKDTSFDEIITEIFEKTGRVEASFSSKMLATINPNMPIWDQYVLEKLGIRTGYQYTNKNKQLEDAKANYKMIVNWYKQNLTDERISEFDKAFPNFKDINATKKIDFLLWGIRNDDLATIDNNIEPTNLINNEISKIKKIINEHKMTDDQLSATIEALEDLIKYIS